MLKVLVSSFPPKFSLFISLDVTIKLKNTYFPIKVPLGSLEAAEEPFMHTGQSTQLGQVQARAILLM